MAVVTFAVAWWLGLYLLARDPAKPALRRAGAGLLSYALALAVGEVDPGGGVLYAVLLSLPAVLWTGTLLALQRTPGRADMWWRRVALPVAVLAAAGAGYAGGVALVLLTVVVLVPLGWTVVLLVRRPGAGLMAALMLGLAAGLLLVGLGVPPRPLWLAGIGLDLAALGVCVALLDSLEEGETLRRDMLGSLLVAGVTAALFGGIVLAAGAAGIPLLLHGVVAAAIAVQVLARPIQSAADRLALPPALRRSRGELREAAAALPRRDDTIALAELPEAEFVRLTRRALSHYGDLGKLVASPLTALPAIDERLGGPGAPLDRAAELKALLLESITRLKPRDGEFGTSEEWRLYNALYFYYVAGIRPYSVRTKLTEPDPVARRALAWFADHVPERTLHNWQAAAARVVAADLRAGLASRQ